LLRKRNQAWQHAINTDTPESWQNHEFLATIFRHQVRQAQTQAWRDFCDTLSYSTDSKYVTHVINELTDTPNPFSANILNHPITRKPLVSPCDQANAFRIHFANISRRPHVPSSERHEYNNLRHSVNEYINKINIPNSPDAKPFTMAELKLAIKRLPSNKAPGEDGIFNQYIKHFDKSL
jgi:hypothetical protein